MARLAVCLLLVLLGAAHAAVESDAATAILQQIVDRIVHRYEEEDYNRRVCGTEMISTSNQLLYRNRSMVPSGVVEAPVCCQGYERNATTLKCMPKCRKECVNARCVAPDLCRCLPQFARSLAAQCVATCPTSCLNGRCYGERCVCDSGYTLDGRICKPKCHGDCVGGNCTAPNVCNCSRAGYTPNKDGECKPSCQGGCVNARCSAPNVCTCLDGFKKRHDRGANPNVCVPDCYDKCVQGFCAGPGKCTCHPGYTIDRHHKFVCVPHCQPPCTNGTCTAPGVCTCKQGYVKMNNDGSSHVCVPAAMSGGGGACRNCANGWCSGGSCVCYDGYYQDQATGRCVPHCSTPCGHGTCSAPNTCNCEPGYTFDFYKKQCLMSCSPPCQHGTCADGNTCVCNPGYARDNTDWSGRRCLPLCDPPCINGVCSSPNNCICNAGFVKDTAYGNGHVCVPRYGGGSNAMATRSYG